MLHHNLSDEQEKIVNKNININHQKIKKGKHMKH